MSKSDPAKLVLTRFEDLKASADETRAKLERMTATMRAAEREMAGKVPVEYVVAWTSAIDTVRRAVRMVDGAKSIADENQILHRALQERELVQYGTVD